MESGIVDIERRVTFFILQAYIDVETLQQEAAANIVSISSI